MALTNLSPINRLEKFLNKIAGVSVSISAITRKEFFLNKIAEKAANDRSRITTLEGKNFLPTVNSSDSGKVATVNSSGTWVAAAAPGGLPSMSGNDNGKVLTCVYDGASANASWEAVGASAQIMLDGSDYVLAGIDFYTIDSLLSSGASIRFEEELADGSFVYSSNFHYETAMTLDVIFTYYSGTDLRIDVFVYDDSTGTFTKTSRKISTSAV